MIKEITPTELAAWLKESGNNTTNPAPVVLDVREPFEVDRANLRGTIKDVDQLIHIPMQQVPAALTKMDTSVPTVVVCHHGGRSYQVAIFMQRQGFENVINLAGGIDGWSKQVDSTVPIY